MGVRAYECACVLCAFLSVNMDVSDMVTLSSKAKELACMAAPCRMKAQR
jgi:hypothetical protein